MTTNLEEQIKEHNSGLNRWTHRGSNWTLFYSEIHSIPSSARELEKYFKTTAVKEWVKRRNFI